MISTTNNRDSKITSWNVATTYSKTPNTSIPNRENSGTLYTKCPAPGKKMTLYRYIARA